jgi:hypothetical protein
MASHLKIAQIPPTFRNMQRTVQTFAGPQDNIQAFPSSEQTIWQKVTKKGSAGSQAGTIPAQSNYGSSQVFVQNAVLVLGVVWFSSRRDG